MYRSEDWGGGGGAWGAGGGGGGQHPDSRLTPERAVICEFDSVKRSSDTELIPEKSVKSDLVNDEQLL